MPQVTGEIQHRITECQSRTSDLKDKTYSSELKDTKSDESVVRSRGKKEKVRSNIVIGGFCHGYLRTSLHYFYI